MATYRLAVPLYATRLPSIRDWTPEVAVVLFSLGSAMFSGAVGGLMDHTAIWAVEQVKKLTDPNKEH